MYLNNVFCTLLFIILSIFLPACRVAEWGKQTFYQGCKINVDLSRAREYLRTARVYDQFATQGIFNVLWLSEDVLRAYSKLYAEKFALDENAEMKLFERQKANFNNDIISFYILAYVPGNDDPLIVDKCNGDEIPWKIYLKSGETAYEPILIKEVVFQEEFKIIFDKIFTRFKTQYLVQFNLKDSKTNEPLINPAQPLTLCLNSTKRKVAIIWNLDDQGNLVTQFDEYGICKCPRCPDQTCEACMCAKIK